MKASLQHTLSFSLSILVTITSTHASPPDPREIGRQLDEIIYGPESLSQAQVVDDATYLRRISLDLVGRPPSAGEITAFGLNPAEDKRSAHVSELLDRSEYAVNWTRYWRDTIFSRATNIRAALVRPAFEEWMEESLKDNHSWKQVATDLLTATGDVNKNGATALIFAHEGEPEEIASEASRIFLGIQIQCANCHDHPWDRWKREQFHEFAAFFPRVSLRRDPEGGMFDFQIVSMNQDRSRRAGVSRFVLSRIDRNRDDIISEAESKGTLLERLFSGQAKDLIDKNGDGRLSIEEITTAQPPDNNRPGQGSTEHYMADLSDPSSRGTLIHPAFFADEEPVRRNLSDLDRREAVSELVTSSEWFAKSTVNRIWSELTSTAFYQPIDDIGPDRKCEHEAALELLSTGFRDSGYDLKWLMTAITSTRLYQRPIDSQAEGFLRLEPRRLRSDQLYDALCQTLNVTALPLRFTGRRVPSARTRDLGREQFADTFGFDPSVPRDDLTGSIPEALFMMNSPELASFVRSSGQNSLISRISRQVLSDEDVIRELYLVTVGREPQGTELQICMQHLAESPSRSEGLEDILWSLLNGTEYQSRS